MTRVQDPQAPEPRRRRLSHPWLSSVIAASWLLLHGSLAPAHLLWAAIMGIGLPWLLHDFIGPGRPLRAATTGVRLALVVLCDIVLANFAVARLVLHPSVQPKPAWVRVRPTVADPRGIALLATIITMTPGTVSCVVDEEAGEVLVHVLDAGDPDAVVAEILHRYDRPLKEIFG